MLKLLPEDDLILKQECKPFDFDNPPVDPKQLVEDLKLAMIDNFGVGLSANQVGLPYKVFVFGDPTDPQNIQSVFNPKLLHSSDEEVLIEEGCLSYPGLFIKIKRPGTIRVRYANEQGIVNTYVYDKEPARIFLHEYDHMDGITFKERATPVRLAMAFKQKRKLDRLRKQKARQA